jgi:hypothetical protein
MSGDVSRPARTTLDKPGHDGQSLRPAIRRAALLPAWTGATGEDGPPRAAALSPTGRLDLLDYAAFLLEQEACYCQQ